MNKQLEKLDELLASASKRSDEISNEVEKNFHINRDNMEFYKYQRRMNDEEYNLYIKQADNLCLNLQNKTGQ
uniref:Uncharacterized protein n=1 Tax=viral metagenome TaxID=1070528 RepID=A0A6M3XWV0_9ZZZZ